MKQIPKHAELIKLWADGALIQWKDEERVGWQDCYNNLPTWSPQFKYRVKPEPKPDVVRYACLDIDRGGWATVRSNLFTSSAFPCDNLMIVFDGETGVLKDAQVLAQE